MMLAGLVGGMGLKVALLGVLAVAIGGAYWHYTVVKGERDAAIALVGALQVADTVQKETISTLEGVNKEWKTSLEEFQDTLDAVADNQIEANEHARRLNDVLSKHDLERLSLAKPGLIERRINRGSADILGMFESATARGSDRPGGN
jgi:hypothetical protein